MGVPEVDSRQRTSVAGAAPGLGVNYRNENAVDTGFLRRFQSVRPFKTAGQVRQESIASAPRQTAYTQPTSSQIARNAIQRGLGDISERAGERAFQGSIRIGDWWNGVGIDSEPIAGGLAGLETVAEATAESKWASPAVKQFAKSAARNIGKVTKVVDVTLGTLDTLGSLSKEYREYERLQTPPAERSYRETYLNLGGTAFSTLAAGGAAIALGAAGAPVIAIGLAGLGIGMGASQLWDLYWD